MNVLTWLVNNAETTLPLCALITYAAWRLHKANRIVDEIDRLERARTITGRVQ